MGLGGGSWWLLLHHSSKQGALSSLFQDPVGLPSGHESPDRSGFLHAQLPSKTLVPEMEDEDEEDDSEDAINEFDFLGSGEDGEGSPDPRRCAAEGPHRELGEWTVFCPAFLGELSGGTHSCLQLLPALGSAPDSYTS